MSNVLFIAATGKDVGKTSISLSLIHLLRKKYKRIGYIKPISQRFIQFSDYKVGDDPVLIKEVFNLKDDINDMSPIVIDGDFTEKIIQGKVRTSFSKKVLKAYAKIKKEADFIIIEGAGHAGVGAVIGQSNADIAKLLNADVLLIGGGGIGRAIDKMMLDKSFFEARGCRVMGVIINKVFEEKYEKISTLLRKWFQKKQIPLFGILPYRSFLSMPDLLLVKKETNSVLIHGEKYLDNKIEQIIIATKGTEAMLEVLRNINCKTLLIIADDRIDLFLTVTSSLFQSMPNSNKLSGILVSGDERVSGKIRDIFKNNRIPVLLSKKTIYELSSRISSLKPKMVISDKDNIRSLKEIAEKYIDINALCESLMGGVNIQKVKFRTRIKLLLVKLFKKIKLGLKKV